MARFTSIGSGGGGTGADGLSAYQIAVTNGFVGTQQEWLESLVGKTLELPSDVPNNYTLAYFKKSARLVGSDRVDPTLKSPTEYENTFTVELGEYIYGDYITIYSRTYTIPTDGTTAAQPWLEYGSPFSLVYSLSLQSQNTGFKFGYTDLGHAFVEIDPDYYPINKDYVIKVIDTPPNEDGNWGEDSNGDLITSSTSIAPRLGFTFGEESATPEFGEWELVDSKNIPAVQDLDNRVSSIEFNGAGGGGLSASRQRKNRFVYQAGPMYRVDQEGSDPVKNWAGTGWTQEFKESKLLEAYPLNKLMMLKIPGLKKKQSVVNGGLRVIGSLNDYPMTTDSIWGMYLFQCAKGSELPSTYLGKVATITLNASSDRNFLFTKGDYDSSIPATLDTTATTASPLLPSGWIVIPEDGDYWLGVCLRSGPAAPVHRYYGDKTQVYTGDQGVGDTWDVVGSIGYAIDDFPVDDDLTPGLLIRDPNNDAAKDSIIPGFGGFTNIPFMAFQIGV